MKEQPISEKIAQMRHEFVENSDSRLADLCGILIQERKLVIDYYDDDGCEFALMCKNIGCHVRWNRNDETIVITIPCNED